MRAPIVAMLAVGLFVGHPALGAELMLDEAPADSHTAWGWTFLALSAVSLAYAVQQNSDAQDSLDNANASFTQYQAAGDGTTAATLRVQTSSYLNDARTEEKRANVGFYAAILFGLTSYYSFFREDLPGEGFSLTHTGFIYRQKF